MYIKVDNSYATIKLLEYQKQLYLGQGLTAQRQISNMQDFPENGLTQD